MFKTKVMATKHRLPVIDNIVLSILSLLYILIPSVSFSQTQSHYKTKIDSVKKLVVQSQRDDTIKIKNLFNLGHLYFYDDEYSEGLKAINQARLLSEKVKFNQGEGLYLSSMMVFHRYNKLYEVFRHLIDPYYSKWNIMADYLIQIEPSNAQPDFQLIKGRLFKALNLFDTITNRETIANIHAALFYRLLDIQHLDSALLQGKIAEDYYNDLDKREEAFRLILDKIFFYNDISNKEALKNEEFHAIDYLNNTADKKTKAYLYEEMGFNYDRIRRLSSLVQCFLRSKEIWEELGDKKGQINAYHQLGVYVGTLEGQESSLNYFLKELSIRKEIKDSSGINETYSSMTYTCIGLGKLEDAAKYLLLAKSSIERNANPFQQARLFDAEGQLLQAQKMYPQAILKFEKSAELFGKTGFMIHLSYIYARLANCYQSMGNPSESLQSATLAFDLAAGENWADTKISASLLISELYAQLHNIPKAYEYLKLHNTIKNEWDSKGEISRAADFEMQSLLNEHQRKIDLLNKNNILSEARSKSQKLWLIMISGVLLSVILLALLLFRNIKQKGIANAKLEQQKNEINLKGLELQASYENLKSTQSQLIQSEKMASLGELAAGIAHEIQNPLNFVNNFSEVNKELLGELRTEIKKGNIEEVNAIANDLEANEEKINHHGKRADAIVKGMLQHSRATSSQKEPTNINALADEYLRLSYHGLRAKDKSFNATLQTDFDESIGKINIIPQDIGRVLLNLYNNAFYAVTEKKKQQPNDYEPKVFVSTKAVKPPSGGLGVVISVKDNGNGIPQKVIDKIFQPFFTTKPTGQGTGLGLSLSYDVIKAHGGEIKVETKEGEGSVFIIKLPVV